MEIQPRFPDSLERDVSKYLSAHNLQRAALICFSIPIFIVGSAFLALLILSGFDHHHDTSIKWWDVLRYIGFFVTMFAVSISAAILSVKIIYSRKYSNLKFISTIFGIATSLSFSILLCLAYYLVERYLFSVYTHTYKFRGGFHPRTSLPSESPVVTLLGFSVVVCFALALYLPTSWFSFWHLRKFHVRSVAT